jgi:hypothetical protein
VSAATDLSWLPVVWPADPRRAQPSAPTTQNLTTQALRMKGVPEADIAAATGNPEMMKQIIIQHFGPGSAGAAARTGYAPYGSSVGGGSFGGSGQRVYPGTYRFDDARSRPELITPQPVQLKCVGWNGCPNGGSFGYGGMYSVGGQILCESCAVKNRRRTSAEHRKKRSH